MKCYNCDQFGHPSRACPLPSRRPAPAPAPATPTVRLPPFSPPPVSPAAAASAAAAEEAVRARLAELSHEGDIMMDWNAGVLPAAAPAAPTAPAAPAAAGPLVLAAAPPAAAGPLVIAAGPPNSLARPRPQHGRRDRRSRRDQSSPRRQLPHPGNNYTIIKNVSGQVHGAVASGLEERVAALEQVVAQQQQMIDHLLARQG